MKKFTFLVLGVLLAFNLSVFAEDGDPIQFYGVAHVSVDSIDNGQDSSMYVSSNASRFGVKGAYELEALGTAIYQIESLVIYDDSGSSLATRNTYIGLKGAAGVVLAGRHDTPFKEVGTKTQGAFGDRVGDYRNIFGGGPVGFDLRPNNVIAYGTPSFGGVSALVAYVAEEGVDNNDAVSGKVEYKNDMVTVAAGYETHGEGLTGTTDATTGIKTDSAESESGIRLAVGVKPVDMLKIEAMYETLSDVGGVSGADRDTVGGSVTVSVAEKTSVKGEVYTTDGIDTTDDSGALMYAVGVDQKLSDVTTIYLVGGVSDNDDQAKYSVTGGGGHEDKVVPAKGDKNTAISLGLIHKF